MIHFPLYISLIFFIFHSKHEVHLYFEPSSTETCTLHESQIGRFHSETQVKRYVKIQQVNDEIDFYICNEKFQFKVLKHTLDIGISSSDIRSKILGY